MCFYVIWLIFVFNSRPHGASCPLLSTFKVLLRALHQDECWPHQCPECAEMFSLPVIRASCLPPRPLRPALPVGPLAQLCTNKASAKHRTDPFPQFHFFQIWKCIPAFGRLPLSEHRCLCSCRAERFFELLVFFSLSFSTKHWDASLILMNETAACYMLMHYGWFPCIWLGCFTKVLAGLTSVQQSRKHSLLTWRLAATGSTAMRHEDVSAGCRRQRWQTEGEL